MADKILSTALCHATTDRIVLRGRDLVADVMGTLSYSETLYMLMLGRLPTKGEARILDTVLVTLMDHGMTPHAISARLTWMSAPEAIQGALAAGILAVGERFAGAMEESAKLIIRIAASASDEEADAAAEAIASDYKAKRKGLPGFGHPLHKPDDPRSPRLFAVAEEAAVDGRYVAALKRLSTIVDRVYGRHLTINATGAIAAVLSEIGIPAPMMRGIAVISRVGGLLAQLNEEHERQMAPALLKLVETNVSYDGV